MSALIDQGYPSASGEMLLLNGTGAYIKYVLVEHYMYAHNSVGYAYLV